MLMSDFKIGGIYKHFKGGKYQVIDTATHTETNETLVIYKSLKHGRVWARPIGMFMGKVERDGVMIDRLVLVGNNTNYPLKSDAVYVDSHNDL